MTAKKRCDRCGGVPSPDHFGLCCACSEAVANGIIEDVRGRRSMTDTRGGAGADTGEPSVDGLDVERLTRAMEDVFPGWQDETPGTAEAQAEMRDYAEQLNAAYRWLADSASPPDRHEGPTPRDCPECQRLHDDVDRGAESVARDLRGTAWLIERGQPEKQVPTVWWSSADADWTTDANRAARFSSREAAQAFIEQSSPIPSHRDRFGRAVEHGWMEP